jgi:hypothetical protein
VGRALVIESRTVDARDRAGALREWRARRERIEAAGGHCWVYESAATPGRFVIFTEAKDAETLRVTRARDGVAGADDDILQEVELR